MLQGPQERSRRARMGMQILEALVSSPTCSPVRNRPWQTAQPWQAIHQTAQQGCRGTSYRPTSTHTRASLIRSAYRWVPAKLLCPKIASAGSMKCLRRTDANGPTCNYALPIPGLIQGHAHHGLCPHNICTCRITWEALAAMGASTSPFTPASILTATPVARATMHTACWGQASAAVSGIRPFEHSSSTSCCCGAEGSSCASKWLWRLF